MAIRNKTLNRGAVINYFHCEKYSNSLPCEATIWVRRFRLVRGPHDRDTRKGTREERERDLKKIDVSMDVGAAAGCIL